MWRQGQQLGQSKPQQAAGACSLVGMGECKEWVHEYAAIAHMNRATQSQPLLLLPGPAAPAAKARRHFSLPPRPTPCSYASIMSA